MQTAEQQSGSIRYVYDLDGADPASSAPSSAEVDVHAPAGNTVHAGVAVGGARACVALLRVPRGSVCNAADGGAERFFFVLDGCLTADIDGRLLKVPARHALHVPAAMPYVLEAAEDTAFIAAISRGADLSAGAAWHGGTGAVTAPRTRPATDGSVRFVYAIDELDAVPPGVSSAKVVPKNFVSGKSSSFGAALSGSALHVGVIHKARGSGAKLHTHPNEQFNVVLAGRLIGEIAGAEMKVVPYGLIHMPAGVQHCTAASGEGDLTVFVVKDTSHGLSGPPVDGIEDGPRYLPGFGPQGANTGNQSR